MGPSARGRGLCLHGSLSKRTPPPKLGEKTNCNESQVHAGPPRSRQSRRGLRCGRSPPGLQGSGVAARSRRGGAATARRTRPREHRATVTWPPAALAGQSWNERTGRPGAKQRVLDSVPWVTEQGDGSSPGALGDAVHGALLPASGSGRCDFLPPLTALPPASSARDLERRE